MSASFQLSCVHRVWRLASPEDPCRIGASALLADPGGTGSATPVRSRAEAARSQAGADERLGSASDIATPCEFGLPR